MADPVPLSESLDHMMRSLRGADRRQLSGVFGRWVDAVGQDLAQHVRPLKVDGGVLTVGVEDAAWATQVAFVSATIIERLREVAQVEIERVEVRVAPR